MVKLLGRAWKGLLVVVLEGKMHWAIGRIGWRGRRERWRSIVVVVVVMVMMVYLDAVVFIVVLIIVGISAVGIFTVGVFAVGIFTVGIFAVVFTVVFPVVCHGRVVLGEVGTGGWSGECCCCRGSLRCVGR